MNINYNQVLYADRYSFSQNKKYGVKWNILRAFHNLFFTSFKFPHERKTKFLFFRSMVRDDYKRMFNLVADTVEHKIVIEDFLKTTKNAAPKAIVMVLTNLIRFFAYDADSLSERIYLYFRLCFYYRVSSALNKFEFEYIVFHADMQPLENLLSQHYNKKGKITATMQHGLYVDYKDFPTINTINYKHQPSTYFLSWGEDTSNLIRRYHPGHNIIICGKPEICNVFDAKKFNTERSESDYFTVVFDQRIFDHENRILLQIMTEFMRNSNLKMNVRFHPQNDKKAFRNLGFNFTEDRDILNSAFVVGHTSSLLHELLFLNIPVFKLISDKPSVSFPLELTFRDSKSLNLSLNNNHQFSKLSKKYIKCIGHNSINNYRSFFNGLLTN